MKIKILQRLLCTHDYRLTYTCEYSSKYEDHRIKVDRCVKCGKIKKSTI